MAPDAAAPPPAKLACGQPTRFLVGADSLTAMAAAPTQDGFAVFGVNGTSVRGWSYTMVGTALAAVAEDVAVATSESGAIGATAQGDQLMVSAVYGTPPAGTATQGLDAMMHPLASADQRDGQLAATDPLACGPSGYAFATIDATSGEGDARLLATSGGDAGAPVAIVPAAEGPGALQVIATQTGYAAAYQVAAANPNTIEVEILDGALGIAAGPIVTSDGQDDAANMQMAWSPGANAFAVTWQEKNATSGDDVWVEIVDSSLNVLSPATIISPLSNDPVVAADADGFWVSWFNYGVTPNALQAAHVATDGTVTARPVTNSGGTAKRWQMVSRDGQPVLVWTETGGTGPDLYFDPMTCP